MARNEQKAVVSIGRYELWFIAQLTMGLVYIGGAMFLLPPFTLSLPGATPGDVGIVMAVLTLIALAAPLVGGLLDKFDSFRLFQLLGLGLFALGFGVLALVDELIGTTFGALILGVGAALVLTTNMGLMAGSGLPDDELNGRMSLLQMSLPLGQFLGLATVAGLLSLDIGFSGIFAALAVTAASAVVVRLLSDVEPRWLVNIIAFVLALAGVIIVGLSAWGYQRMQEELDTVAPEFILGLFGFSSLP